MESDRFYGDSVVKLVWRLSGNFIYHVFYVKLQKNYITPKYHGDKAIFLEVIFD